VCTRRRSASDSAIWTMFRPARPSMLTTATAQSGGSSAPKSVDKPVDNSFVIKIATRGNEECASGVSRVTETPLERRYGNFLEFRLHRPTKGCVGSDYGCGVVPQVRARLPAIPVTLR